MKKITYLIILMVTISFSQTPKGKDIVNLDKNNHLHVNKEFGKITKLKDSIGNTEYLIETLVEPKFIYNCATKISTNHSSYKKGRVFLISYKAKTIKSSLETGEAKILWQFKQWKDYTGTLSSTQSVSSNWQTYYVPFESNRDISEEDFAIVMQYGYRPQAFKIKDIKVEEFPMGTDINDLPKTKITYAGMEPDAKWRKDALARIETIRKGNFTVQLTDNDKPLASKQVNIKLVRHLFPFGAAMDAQDIFENNDQYSNFKKAFNYTVLANDLKIKSWEKDHNKERTLEALKILQKDNIDVKGHVLIWPGFQYLTEEIRVFKNDSAKVRLIIENHVKDILEKTKGKVIKWDVVNECYTNQDLQTITGSEDILYGGFKASKAIQPNAYRFLNEYGIISKGGLDTKKQQWYYDFIKRIDENTGGLVQGIGIQSHIGSDLTPPERVLEILAFYATLGKQISISEFTMDIQEPEIREQYTRDFMIAAFSHPSVVEFLFWGFTENEKKKVDILKQDGTIGNMGKAFFDLVHNQWKTNLNGSTDEKGFASGRGFLGTYEVTFIHNGTLIKKYFTLKPRQRGIVKIELN